MSTNANLPEGFIITSINGKRCTQVPRSLTTIAGETSFATTTTEAAQTTTSSTPPPGTTTSSAQVQVNSPNVAASAISASGAVPTTSIATTPPPETTTNTPPPAAAATTSVAPVETVTPAAVSSTSTSTSETSTSASPASKGTTPTISSSTSIPLLQSEVSATPTSTGISNDGGVFSIVSSKSTSSITATTTSARAEESSASAGISSNPKLTAAPVVGGVMGGMALIGIIGLLLWYFRRKRRRDSLLTPLTTGTRERFYEIDGGSVGPTKPFTKWKANLGYQSEKIRDVASGLKAGFVGIACSLKSKVSGDRSDTPSVNLNRGNSQFLDGPIPQHSRNNSSVLPNNTSNLTVKERFKDWWEHFTETVNFNWRLRRKERQSMDPFTSARSMTEKQANINGPPDFSQLLGMDDRELQLQAQRRRASLSQSFPNLGSLGLDFSAQTQAQEIADPFSDPPSKPNTKANQPWAPPNPSSKVGTNPFADPIAPPQRSIPKQNTYISEIRRSRGLSMDATNPSTTNNSNPNLPPSSSNNKTTSIAPTSRYPSSIAPTSRDSYRDTVFSSFTANTRKGKGRSDPFDLERPELWRPKFQSPPMPAQRDSTRDLYPNPLRMSSMRGQAMAGRDSHGAQPRVVSVSTPRIISATGTYTSKYSSGVSSLGEWGDPGPDLGPSQGSSLRGEVGSMDRSSSELVYGQGSAGVLKGSLVEMSPTTAAAWDARRARDNASPVSLESKASSKGGVGKAM